MGFGKYLEDVMPTEMKAFCEGAQVRTVKFKNIEEFMNMVMSGDSGISLELSGKKDGKKVFLKISGKNLQDVIEKYDDYFDEPMDMEQKDFMIKAIMKSAIDQLKESSFKMEGPVNVDADINEPLGGEENPEIPEEPETPGEPESEEQPVQKMQKEKRDTAEQQEF